MLFEGRHVLVTPVGGVKSATVVEPVLNRSSNSGKNQAELVSLRARRSFGSATYCIHRAGARALLNRNSTPRLKIAKRPLSGAFLNPGFSRNQPNTRITGPGLLISMSAKDNKDF